MASTQTILFTVMPRGLRVNPTTLPVSVIVSPRLVNGSLLKEFPDWLRWTRDLLENGLTLTLRCGGHNLSVDIDRKPLRPDLWEAMFNEETYVRSHTFQDYSQRAIFSYPTRLALSAVKSIYQDAGVLLGLPDANPQSPDERQGSPYRRILKGLLDGLSVNWNEDMGAGLRKEYRANFQRLGDATSAFHYDPSWLAADGTLKTLPAAGTPASKNFHQFLGQQFALYTHMPQGAALRDNPPDFKTLIDFHQALSSLNSYPELLRALGLVFDLELPASFVDHTPLATPGTLAVVDLPHKQWKIATAAPPKSPNLETAYLYFSVGDPAHPFNVFTTAPGLLGGGLSDLEVFGLLNLDPTRFGLAQVDVESGMHKTTLLAQAWQEGREEMGQPDHPEVFDETTTLPALRSGGFSVFADARALRLLKSFQENTKYNKALGDGSISKKPFFAEDLVHGYRIDIWDSFTNQWNSLHRRFAEYTIGELTFKPAGEVEGFNQLAAAQSAPDPKNPPPDDLYLNESVARWAGWSLSVPFPGKVLSRDADPAKALDEDPNHPQNEPATPFKMTTHFSIAPKSLPALRFGRRYRLRVRAVDLAGNSMSYDDPMANLLAFLGGLPRDPEGVAYLRYQPVAAPTVVLRDASGVTGPGSQLNRLVIRTFNSDPSLDGSPADLSGSQRWIVPPNTSVEVGERLGMFDKAGRLDTSSAMYDLIGKRDKGKLNEITATVAGQEQTFPLEGGSLDELPYLPDALARGAALRDLPGSPAFSLAAVEPGAGASAPLPFQTLDAANPRRGSAALVGFGGAGDWQKLQPFLLAPLDQGSQAPVWDPAARVLNVSLPKGSLSVVPLSSYLRPDDLKLMGVWQWLREIIDLGVIFFPGQPAPDPRFDQELIQHLLQRALEGGHWMITPPRLLTLVHAVQQPLGSPEFTRLSVQHQPYGSTNAYGQIDELLNPDPNVLQTAPESVPTAESELATLTAWRKPGSPDAYLLGGLKVHGASTEKIDVLAEWSDPYDDVSQPRLEGVEYRQTHNTQADEVPLPTTREGYVSVGQGTANFRNLGYYDADHDLLCFVRSGDELGNLASGKTIYSDAAPCHYFNDTRYHKVTYTARSTSRFREYFDQTSGLIFTRISPAVVVQVPASARPSAPSVSYIVPTFGWQRQTQSNLKRSVRFGGGLRIYLERPWFSSGDGELLGVGLYDYGNGVLNNDGRELWKPYVTQWGGDPIWLSANLYQLPSASNFLNRIADEPSLSLPGRAPGRIGVAGFAVDFDTESQKWFADVHIDVQSQAYTPFLRLALLRYQPFALPDAKLSPAVLADYIQLTPERSAMLTADPYHPRSLRLTVSGPAPSGPAPTTTGLQPSHPVTVPTLVTVTLQRRVPGIQTDMGWEDAPAGTAQVNALPLPAGGMLRWTGSLDFAALPQPGQYRLVVREFEYISANFTLTSGTPNVRRPLREQPTRLIYAETIEIDSALIGGPSNNLGTTINL